MLFSLTDICKRLPWQAFLPSLTVHCNPSFLLGGTFFASLRDTLPCGMTSHVLCLAEIFAGTITSEILELCRAFTAGIMETRPHLWITCQWWLARTNYI